MPDMQRHWERYFQVTSRWIDPDQYERILRSLQPEDVETAITVMKDLGLIGEPKAVRKRAEALMALVERAEAWERRRRDIITFLRVFTGVGIAVGTLRAYFPELFSWWTK